MVRLARPGRVLAPLARGRSGYGVFAAADRRRRPSAIATAQETARALSEGRIEPAGQGAYRLSAAGRAALRRLEDRESETDVFARQHRDLGTRPVIDAQGRIETVAVNLSESPLARYARATTPGGAPLLSPEQVMAGERLRIDYHRSAMGSPAGSDWTRLPGGKTRGLRHDPAAAPVSRIDARRRVMDALDAVGPGFDRLLVSVLLRETGMQAAERALDWPDRSGATALKLALGRLAVHYGILAPAAAANPFE
jgi:hypothetical protein